MFNPYRCDDDNCNQSLSCQCFLSLSQLLAHRILSISFMHTAHRKKKRTDYNCWIPISKTPRNEDIPFAITYPHIPIRYDNSTINTYIFQRSDSGV